MKTLVSTKNAAEILRERGLKATPARELILATLGAKRVPRTAQDLFDVLGKKHTIDLVTIYRTLASFEKVGIVNRVDLRRDAVAYELAGEHHHHIVCTECGTVEDFDACGLESLIMKVQSRAKGFAQISAHSLELFGVCRTCAC